MQKNIVPIRTPLQQLSLLRPLTFEYDAASQRRFSLQSGRQYGFLAEEIEPHFPELIRKRSVNYMFGKNAWRQAHMKVVDETRLIPLLVAAIQEQQRLIERLQLEVEGLKKTSAFAELP